MLELVTLLAAAAVLFFIERAVLIAVYASWFRQGYAGDSAFHLAAVREIKRSGTYNGIPEFLMRDERENDTYPVLFHRIAAFFPYGLIERRAYVPNLVIWTSLATAAALYVFYFSSHLLHANGIAVTIVFVLVFATIASNLSLESNGLNYITLSERLLARFALAFYSAAMAVGISYNDELSLGIAVVAGTVGLTTSKFGRQAMVFVTPLVGLILLDPRPLYVLALSFVGACILDRGFFLRGLRHQILFLIAYNKIVKKSRYFKAALSHFVDWRQVLGRGRSMPARIQELELGEPTQLLFRIPELVLVAILMARDGEFGRAFTAVILANLIVYALTITPWLRQFGEAVRYLEYNLWLLVPFMLAVYFTSAKPLPELVLILYGEWVGFFTCKRIMSWWLFKLPDHDEMAELVKTAGIGADDTVFTVPHNLGADVSVRCGARALNYQGALVTMEVYQKFVEEPPLLKRNWKPLAREFQVTFVVADKRYLANMQSVVGWTYDFSELPVIAEASMYVIYAVPAQILGKAQDHVAFDRAQNAYT